MLDVGYFDMIPLSFQRVEDWRHDDTGLAPMQVAILGFNKIFRKPVVKTVNGREEVVIRDWTYFSISLDHRIVDGAVGAEFMKTFIKYIENPSLLLMEAF
jgi:pyruvate/2-oxoglutarate dehydrogenase complex dihydrolipoamide acyltransferase (E2) component